MTIWFKTPTPKEGNALHKDTLVSNLDIRIAHIGEDFIIGSMPVDKRTAQLGGFLHGGASVSLAQTLASYAANCCVDPDKYVCVELDVNANHLRRIRKGRVTAMARPIHLGKKTQVWRIEVKDDNDNLVSEARLTFAVMDKLPA